jgi:hypothetical protein
MRAPHPQSVIDSLMKQTCRTEKTAPILFLNSEVTGPITKLYPETLIIVDYVHDRVETLV